MARNGSLFSPKTTLMGAHFVSQRRVLTNSPDFKLVSFEYKEATPVRGMFLQTHRSKCVPRTTSATWNKYKQNNYRRIPVAIHVFMPELTNFLVGWNRIYLLPYLYSFLPFVRQSWNPNSSLTNSSIPESCPQVLAKCVHPSGKQKKCLKLVQSTGRNQATTPGKLCFFYICNFQLAKFGRKRAKQPQPLNSYAPAISGPFFRRLTF